MSNRPRWLQIGQENLIPLLEHTSASLNERNDLDANVRIASILASFHLHQCVLSSIEANEKGRHSVAIALLRQCVEALTIVDVGLQSQEFATKVLTPWTENKLTQGQIRQKLETEKWNKYGYGLWKESWAEYFGNLARAVQPYAHYSYTLMGWQYSIPAVNPEPKQGDNTILHASFGLNVWCEPKMITSQ